MEILCTWMRCEAQMTKCLYEDRRANESGGNALTWSGFISEIKADRDDGDPSIFRPPDLKFKQRLELLGVNLPHVYTWLKDQLFSTSPRYKLIIKDEIQCCLLKKIQYGLNPCITWLVDWRLVLTTAPCHMTRIPIKVCRLFLTLANSNIPTQSLEARGVLLAKLWHGKSDLSPYRAQMWQM